jgi:hypothetical protein
LAPDSRTRDPLWAIGRAFFVAPPGISCAALSRLRRKLGQGAKMSYDEVIEAAASVFACVTPGVSAEEKLGDLALLAAVTIATWSKSESSEQDLNNFISQVRRDYFREAGLGTRPVLVRFAER